MDERRGQKNTIFFHRSVKAHSARNKILRLQNEDGEMIENYDQVKDMATYFFKKLFFEPLFEASRTQLWNDNILFEA